VQIKMVKKPGFMELLINVVMTEPSLSIRAAAIEIIANLSLAIDAFSLSTNKANFVDLLMLCNLFVKTAADESDNVREASARGLLNLSPYFEMEMSLSHSTELLEVLVQFLNDKNAQTREHAAGALHNMSLCPSNTFVLTNHNRGSMLDVLDAVLRRDSNQVVRKFSILIIYNIIHRKTVQSIASREGLIETTLSFVVNDHSSTEIRTLAVLILSEIALLLHRE